MGALVLGSIAVAQTISPKWVATVEFTGVAAAPAASSVIACGDGLAGGARRSSPPQLTSMAQTSARPRAPSDRRAVVAATGLRAPRPKIQSETLTEPTRPRPLPQCGRGLLPQLYLPAKMFLVPGPRGAH